MPAGDFLMAGLGGYDPIVGGVTAQSRSPLTGLIQTGNPMLDGVLGMFAAPKLQGLYDRFGMTPLGLHSQNAYDILRHQQFTLQQQQVWSAGVMEDRRGYYETLRGMAHLTGTPFGLDQMRAARELSGTMSSPILSAFMPGLMDQLAGPRGSMGSLANQMAMGSRYRFDPVTGQLGMTEQSALAMQRSLTQRFFPEVGMGVSPGVRGLRAGDIGGMYDEFTRRGLLGSDGSLPELGSSRTADALRNFDARAAESTIREYASSIRAIKDILGDMGRPNAPMRELVSALEAFNNGGMGKLSATELGRSARMTYNVAQATGIGMDAAMGLQQHTSRMLQQFGVSPQLAPGITQANMAWTAGFSSQGFMANPAWGAFNVNEATQMDANMRAAAAASPLANRAAAIMRVEESVGGFKPGTEAARLAAQVRGGNIGLIGENQLRDALLATGKVSSGTIDMILRDTVGNERFKQQFGIAGGVRRGAQAQEIAGVLGRGYGNGMAELLREGGVSERDAEALMTAGGTRMASAFIGAADAKRANPLEAQRILGTTAVEVLEESAVGKKFMDRMRRDKGFDRQGLIEQFGLAAGVAGQRGITRELPQYVNPLNAARMSSSAAADREDRVLQEADLTRRFQEDMVGPNTDTLTRGIIGALQSFKPEDDLGKLLATATGGTDIKGVRLAAMTAQTTLQKLGEAQRALRAATTPQAKEKAEANYRQALQNFQTARDTIGRSIQDAGLLTDPGVSARDVASAESGRESFNALGREAERVASAPGFNRKAWLESAAGKDFIEQGNYAIGVSHDVASATLASDSAVSRVGKAGVEMAGDIRNNVQRLRFLAKKFTGDPENIAGLLAGGYAENPETQAAVIEARRLYDRVRQDSDALGKGLKAGGGATLTDVAAARQAVKLMDEQEGKDATAGGKLLAAGKVLSDADADALEKAMSGKNTIVRDSLIRKLSKSGKLSVKDLKEGNYLRKSAADPLEAAIAGARRRFVDREGMEAAIAADDEAMKRAKEIRDMETGDPSVLGGELVKAFGVDDPDTGKDEKLQSALNDPTRRGLAIMGLQAKKQLDAMIGKGKRFESLDAMRAALKEDPNTLTHQQQAWVKQLDDSGLGRATGRGLAGLTAGLNQAAKEQEAAAAPAGSNESKPLFVKVINTVMTAVGAVAAPPRTPES